MGSTCSDNIQGTPVNLQELLTIELTKQLSESLITKVNKEEIFSVIKSLPNNKSPGPDGYTTEFLKASWEVIGELVIGVVQVKKFLLGSC